MQFNFLKILFRNKSNKVFENQDGNCCADGSNHVQDCAKIEKNTTFLDFSPKECKKSQKFRLLSRLQVTLWDRRNRGSGRRCLKSRPVPISSMGVLQCAKLKSPWSTEDPSSSLMSCFLSGRILQNHPPLLH